MALKPCGANARCHVEAPSGPTLASLAAAAGGVLLGDASTVITGISVDPQLRDMQPGALFAPLDLAPARAAALAARAVERGAAAVLLDADPGMPVPRLIVPALRPALAQVAAAFWGQPAVALACIGVTGTAGKTTTTLLLDAILRRAGRRPGLIGTLEWRAGETWVRHESGMTTPEAPQVQRLLRQIVDAGDRWAVIEASSQGLAQHRLDGVPFRIGAITCLTRAHLDFHGSVAAYHVAKGLLFAQVAANEGVAVLNADDPAVRALASDAGERRLWYSASGAPADVRATDVAPGAGGTRFTLTLRGERAPVTLAQPGAWNVANALCAAAIAHAAGLPLAQIVAGLEQAPPMPGLLAMVNAGQPFAVVIDEAKSPLALVQALEFARQCAPQGRVIAVVAANGANPGVLAQTGHVAALAADFTVFTAQRRTWVAPAEILRQLTAGARAGEAAPKRDVACIGDRRDAIAHALGLARPGDCVLLAGKGSDRADPAGGAGIWDEAAVARGILRELGYGERAG
ncbi:MAG: UDP-N-acetylmuramyl-tripeptide synthetase [Thermomicrobiales bacterium]